MGNSEIALVPLRLESALVENLRGYAEATLTFGTFTVLVGNNNEGKSSLPRLVDWLINEADNELLWGRRRLTNDEQEMLFPANPASGRAHRLTLAVRFGDKRKGRGYGEIGAKPALLRLSVMKAARKVRLNCGPPRRNEVDSDKKAVQLLAAVRRAVVFELVPSSRDARSKRFAAVLDRRLKHILLDRFTHERQAGAPGEYRKALKVIEILKAVVERSKTQLEEELTSYLPPGLVRQADLKFDTAPADLAEWVRDHLSLAVSTGEHDRDLVAPQEVGNGLQSVLDVALTLASLPAKVDGQQVIAVIEEPEAFLHPSAQRSLAAGVRRIADEGRAQVVLTTHSPYFVDEAKYGDVVLVRKHRYFPPRIEQSRRGSINTALMSTKSAEVFFSRGVLLVEGPGDVALFDALRRRVQRLTGSVELSQLTVIDVGGKRSFAPWWRLLSSYGSDIDRPIRWLSIMDGDALSDDGERSLLRALKEASLPLDELTERVAMEFGDLSFNDTDKRLESSRDLNKRLARLGVRVFSVDCEWASFGGWAEHFSDLVADVLDCPAPERDAAVVLARRAGSKVRTGKDSDGGRKSPYLRTALGERAPMERIPEEIKSALEAWFSLVMPTDDAVELMRRCAPEVKEVPTTRRSRKVIALKIAATPEATLERPSEGAHSIADTELAELIK